MRTTKYGWKDDDCFGEAHVFWTMMSHSSYETFWKMQSLLVAAWGCRGSGTGCLWRCLLREGRDGGGPVHMGTPTWWHQGHSRFWSEIRQFKSFEAVSGCLTSRKANTVTQCERFCRDIAWSSPGWVERWHRRDQKDWVPRLPKLAVAGNYARAHFSIQTQTTLVFQTVVKQKTILKIHSQIQWNVQPYCITYGGFLFFVFSSHLLFSNNTSSHTEGVPSTTSPLRNGRCGNWRSCGTCATRIWSTSGGWVVGWLMFVGWLVGCQVCLFAWPEIQFRGRGRWDTVPSLMGLHSDRVSFFFSQDIYVISELMETDLASILKSPQPLSDEHCQFFTYQAMAVWSNEKGSWWLCWNMLKLRFCSFQKIPKGFNMF